jgi:hypothetical protein
MQTHDLQPFLRLETAVWNALLVGDATADAQLLDEGFLGVYEDGFAGKPEHVAQLRNGPTIEHFELSDARIKILAPDLVLLSYRAHYVRKEPTSQGKSQVMYVTSIWRQVGGQWLNVFSQDTNAA